MAYLESTYRQVSADRTTGRVFALAEPDDSTEAGWQSQVRGLVGALGERVGRAPTVLDWRTGLGLAEILPEITVFSPVDEVDVLPYVERSVDVVAISAAEPTRHAEARRVARSALLLVDVDAQGAEGEDAEGADGLPHGRPSAAVRIEHLGDAVEESVPSVSIIIPVHDALDHTRTCLAALAETIPSEYDVEVLVVDDASKAETQDFLAAWSRRRSDHRVLHNLENLGFVASCNCGGQAARGDYLVFLNNDTIPLRGWLEALVRTLRDRPDAGAVGGMLLYPDGRLQEAGGVIFSDGSGANFGRGDPRVDHPLYNYLRPVDYCSGALLATPRSLFLDTGGFDECYRPAYYEDTDYCFRVRELGRQVYYQPRSVVVHVEGGTAGTDPQSGIKKHQRINHDAFVRKWDTALRRQPANGHRFDRAAWHRLAVRGATESV
jgi:GT2 family glycosyltransferase